MPTTKNNQRELKQERELNEIIEIARLARSVKEIVKPSEDKTRPIIASKDYGQDIKVIHYSH